MLVLRGVLPCPWPQERKIDSLNRPLLRSARCGWWRVRDRLADDGDHPAVTLPSEGGVVVVDAIAMGSHRGGSTGLCAWFSTPAPGGVEALVP
jgi:hypothetical protein